MSSPQEQVLKSQIGNDCVTSRCTMVASGLVSMVPGATQPECHQQPPLSVWSEVKRKEDRRKLEESRVDVSTVGGGCWDIQELMEAL